MEDESKRSRKRREASEKKSTPSLELARLEHDFEVTNPEEVEARLRRMFYGRPVE